MHLQAAYHGFGLTVQADKMVSTSGQALHSAITHVLTDATYKVGGHCVILAGKSIDRTSAVHLVTAKPLTSPISHDAQA